MTSPLNEAAAARWGTENFPDGIPRAAVDECELALLRKHGDFEAWLKIGWIPYYRVG